MISILVPFRDEPGTARLRNWRWLEKRWRAFLPDAEIVVGTDTGYPFSKTSAVNDAYEKASGDVFLIVDADSWIEPPALVSGLETLQKYGTLIVPWKTSHRLRRIDSEWLLHQDPALPSLVTAEMREVVTEYRPAPSTAAMVTLITREGFERVGGMDPRFRGWGAEDVAFSVACRTLLGPTQTITGDTYALWHERPRRKGRRIWGDEPGHHNLELGSRYWKAKGLIRPMLALCEEHPLPGATHPVSCRFRITPPALEGERSTHQDSTSPAQPQPDTPSPSPTSSPAVGSAR